MLPLNPAQYPAQFRKAQALQQAGRLAEAKVLFEALADLAPKRADIPFQLARIARQEGDGAAALSHLRKAHALKPGEPAIVAALAEQLSAQGEDDEALALLDSLIADHPKNPAYRVEKALRLQRLGEFAAAEVELDRAQKLDPLRGEPYRMLTANRKLKPNDPLIGKMRTALKSPKLGTGARVQIEFAMAKAMEDTGRHDRVFHYLSPANAAMKKAYGYRAAGRREEVDGLIRACEGHDFTPTGPGPAGFAPIFVTGLPRSGTTLVEQILASHSQVTGGGEHPLAVRLAYGLIRTPGRGFTPIESIPPDQIAALGEAYEAGMRRAVAFDRVVTDKAIQSHLVMGLLKQAIPEARFIVVRRDPRDLLFSIYKNMFASGTHRYAYDLEDLAAYYANFLKTLDFWRDALPGGFHEVRYEDLVADPEPQIRALVAAAGLDWEDACLSFHEGKREVRTLSVQQVRQPIYRSSAAAWRKYEADLAPLTRALEREGVQLDGPD
jgi:tetratricopeptide (TPR) repeat protein